MKTWKIATIVTIGAIAALLLVSSVYAMGPWSLNPYGGYGGMMGRGGMMGGGYGYGYDSPPYTTQPGATTQYYAPVYPFQFGGGCIGRFGWNRGYTGTPYVYTGAQLNITTAETIAKTYVASLDNPDLKVNQLEEYMANYYVQINEKSTGRGAFELLINKYTGSIYPEMGPNMMWNTEYGMMRSGILGGIFGNPTAATTVTSTQATTNAQEYLNTYLPGTNTGDVTSFYGYYTIEVLNGTTPSGMLSVNAYTGQVWYHTWHGSFIQELQTS